MLFIVFAVGAVVPPAVGRLPDITYTRLSVEFIVMTCAAVVIALAAGSLGIAFLVFLLAILSFTAGQHSVGQQPH